MVMANESRVDDLACKQTAAAEANAESKTASSASQAEPYIEEEKSNEPPADETAASSAAAKKEKSEGKRIDKFLHKDTGESRDDISNAVNHLSKSQVSEILRMNPALAQELERDPSTKQAAKALKKLSIEDVMTGLAASGKNAKDIGSYKFWQTQPVPKFGENKQIDEGPLKVITLEDVPKNPGPLIDGFEWVTLDLSNEDELKEVYDLLYGHYVEDSDSMFRLKYSKSFLRWALQPPGWTMDWHVGVRASVSHKLVAFISAVPCELRVRQKVLRASEVNFLCIHKKLRSKRLAPVLIKEVTRRCYIREVWQAIYTAGIVLPTPVSTTRYYHRSIDWQKLNDIDFSPLPRGSKPQYQIMKYKLPDHTSTKGLRAMEPRDVDAVLALLKTYLEKFDMAPIYTREEIAHWLLPKCADHSDQVVWSYVVEDSTTNEVTDFFSFYLIESSVIDSKHTSIRAAYLFYYATTVALQQDNCVQLKDRLNTLINNALIIAKKFKFDVFNALTLMDNALFLEQQKFAPGNGQLNYYLYNYRANPIAGGVDQWNNVDEKECSGMGVAML
ncbi:hypothetical protein VE02_05968 [Pseudogymnoascus sp. 03VT05]|nr:hypothetical protein VE02_05968 [Pseudogymnoascus sp. 03VT05]